MTPEEYAKRLWDWTFLNGCFRYGIRVSDLDGIVERHSHFLVMDGKPPGVQLSRGQRMLYEAMARHNEFTVIILRGHPPDNICGWEVIGKQPYISGDKEDFKEFVSRWFDAVDKGDPKQIQKR